MIHAQICCVEIRSEMCGNLDNNFSGWINKYIACNPNEIEWALSTVSICLPAWLTGLVTFNSNLITVGFLHYQLKRISGAGFLLSLVFMSIYCWFEHDNSTNYWNRLAHFCHLAANSWVEHFYRTSCLEWKITGRKVLLGSFWTFIIMKMKQESKWLFNANFYGAQKSFRWLKTSR